MPSPFASSAIRFLRAVLRTAAIALGAVVALLLLVLGLAMTLGLLGLHRVLGRRSPAPRFAFKWRPRGAASRGFSPPQRQQEVIDVEAREVPPERQGD